VRQQRRPHRRNGHAATRIPIAECSSCATRAEICFYNRHTSKTATSKLYKYVPCACASLSLSLSLRLSLSLSLSLSLTHSRSYSLVVYTVSRRCRQGAARGRGEWRTRCAAGNPPRLRTVSCVYDEPAAEALIASAMIAVVLAQSNATQRQQMMYKQQRSIVPFARPFYFALLPTLTINAPKVHHLEASDPKPTRNIKHGARHRQSHAAIDSACWFA